MIWSPTLAQTGVPRTGVPRTGVPRTGVPRTGVPRTGVPRTGLGKSRAVWNDVGSLQSSSLWNLSKRGRDKTDR